MAASANSPGIVGPLIGRANEWARVCDLLEEAPTRGRALLIRGEPGIGKTALLEQTAAKGLASGFSLLTASGVEFEADLTFSGLHQLLLPLTGLIGQLLTAQRDVLEAALGQSNAAPPNSLQVATATLALLQRAATDGPLLLIVDDFHWLDRASARVLAIAARRLETTRVALCCAVRSMEDDTLAAAGMPILDVPPLDGDAASRLLDSRFPILAAEIRHRLLTEAQGNPLALLQLPAALSAEQRRAQAAVPSLLPLTSRLQDAFASVYGKLPPDTRRILLLASLAGSDRLAVLFGGRVKEQDMDALEPAVANRLVHIDVARGSLTFTHPLIRAAAAGSASASQLRRAHLGLAKLEADDPDRRAWHLAAATLEPDETIAAMLEETGNRNLRRGDPANAANAMLRAAELSPDGPARSRRLTKAAHVGAYITGDLAAVSGLLQDARQSDPEPSAVLYAAATAAVMLVNGDGEIATAHRILTEAIRGYAGDYQQSDDALIASLEALNFVCFVGGSVEFWAPYAAAIDRLSPAPPRELHLLTATFADPAHSAASALDMLTEAIASLNDESEQWRIANIATASVFVDRLAGCRTALWGLVRDGREGEAGPLALTALNMLARDQILSGDWNEAIELCTEGLQLCELIAQPMLAFPLHAHRGTIAALRGNYAEADQAVSAITRWATPRGAWGAIDAAHYIRALVAMSRGNYEAAYQAASSLSPAGSFTPYSPQALYVCMDLVESAVHIGKTVEARAHVAAMQRADVGGLSSRLALLAAGSAALVAPDDRAAKTFEQALTQAESRRWPFDRARVQLNYGERLRRKHGSTIEARSQLAEALDTFTRLEAEPWAARAALELRAAGASRLGHLPEHTATLTPQEYEIATLAATGLTNKQIAKRVFLSDRTVSAHLYRTFPKLGITTRAGLRDALNSQASPGNGT